MDFGCGSDGRLGVSHFLKRDGSKRLMKCYVSIPTIVGPLGRKGIGHIRWKVLEFCNRAIKQLKWIIIGLSHFRKEVL